MFTAEFLITSLIVVLIPGTGVVFTVSTGLVHGRRASLFASVGCTLGIPSPRSSSRRASRRGCGASSPGPSLAWAHSWR
jgi:hypothetical protein